MGNLRRPTKRSQERDRSSRAQLAWHRRVSRSPDEAWASVDRYEQTWFLPVWPACDISHRADGDGLHWRGARFVSRLTHIRLLRQLHWHFDWRHNYNRLRLEMAFRLRRHRTHGGDAVRGQPGRDFSHAAAFDACSNQVTAVTEVIPGACIRCEPRVVGNS